MLKNARNRKACKLYKHHIKKVVVEPTFVCPKLESRNRTLLPPRRLLLGLFLTTCLFHPTGDFHADLSFLSFLSFFSFFLSKFYLFICQRERERERHPVRAGIQGGGVGEEEAGSQRRSLMRCWIPECRDHALSRRQRLND